MHHQVRHMPNVALRKESVDRNVPEEVENYEEQVALRKESVDRNEYIQAGTGILNLSLSARRAWIEIYYADKDADWVRVALRKESVDRNSRLDFEH